MRSRERCSFRSQLEKDSKLTTKVLHPRNCKQNVPKALAIFHETTATPIQFYFADEKSTVEFLKLFSTWWVISSSKTAFSTNNYLGNTAINGDQKPSILRAMAKSIQAWQTIQEFPTAKSLR